MNELIIPLDVPENEHERYSDNLISATGGTGRLMLFAGDQKVEHLNDDFVGNGVAVDDADPEHLFRIAERAKIGAFATQFGNIARYATDHRRIPYIVKMNSKTNLIKTAQAEPISLNWVDVEQVVTLRDENDLDIKGVGMTVYLGSENETVMLSEASNMIYHAHQNGLLSVIWMYPRGKAVPNEKDPHLIAGAAGVAACLGSDFVKINYPQADNAAERLKEAVKAAGRTKVICSGGHRVDAQSFLNQVYDQIHISGAGGAATGRNVHQRPLEDAIRMCNAIYSITVEEMGVEETIKKFGRIA